MARFPSLSVVFVLACGSGASRDRLQLAVQGAETEADQSIQLSVQSGEQKDLVLLALGAESADVHFALTGAPAFVSLDQSVLSVRPTRAVAGAYSFSVAVHDGKATATQEFVVTVGRSNAAPQVTSAFLGDTAGEDKMWICPGPGCVLNSAPLAIVSFCDPDGDDVIFDLEVVPHGSPFTGTPTTSQRVSGSALCNQSAALAFPSLQPGTTYDYALRLTDALGAVGTFQNVAVAGDGGWVHFGTFEQGPCAAGQVCACVAPQSICWVDADCCSGSCSQTPGGVGFCR